MKFSSPLFSTPNILNYIYYILTNMYISIIIIIRLWIVILYHFTQVSNIIRNLSLEKKNVIALGENKLLLMYVKCLCGAYK